jgi:hypothetical protein
MGVFLAYLRGHRWQRRSLTILLAVAVGMGGAIILQPVLREYYLLRDLASEDVAVRRAAIARAAAMARQYPRVLDRLNREIGRAGDSEFQAIAEALDMLGLFNAPGRDANQFDRLRLIEFMQSRASPAPGVSRAASTGSAPASGPAWAQESAAGTRLILFQDSVFAGRDNIYTRRLLAAAAGDESPAVRQAAAVLAARFADANTLLKLLGDPDPNVAEWAAIDAGLAELRPLQEAIYSLGHSTKNGDVLSAAVYASRLFNPTAFGNLLTPDNPRINDRLIHASTLDRRGPPPYNSEDFRLAAEAAKNAGQSPSASVLSIAGPESAGRLLLEIVADANRFSGEMVLAAVRWSGPAPAAIEALLRDLWQPRNAMVLTELARRLGSDCDDPDANEHVRGRCLDTLRRAAGFDAGIDSNSPELALAVPAAAAAVALWRREPSSTFLFSAATESAASGPADFTRFDSDSTAYLVYHASCAGHYLAGDYIAWHLAAAGDSSRAIAFQLGMNMLPAPWDPRGGAARGFHNYSEPSRSCAAMLLALAARTEDEKRLARDRVAARLKGGPLVRPANYHEIGSYKCALLILGEDRFRRDVADLLYSGAFPPRRAITALCIAGERAGLDWLLWDLRASPREIGDIYVGARLGEALRDLVPELPTVDELADEDLREWQARILQDYYRIHRENIRFSQRR